MFSITIYRCNRFLNLDRLLHESARENTLCYSAGHGGFSNFMLLVTHSDTFLESFLCFHPHNKILRLINTVVFFSSMCREGTNINTCVKTSQLPQDKAIPSNGPFPSCSEPHYENEAKCKALLKISFENDVLFSNDTGILGKRNSEFSQQESNLRPSDY